MAATVAGGGGLFVGEDSVFSFLFCPFWFLGVSGRTKQRNCPVVDVTGGESQVQCCNEQYCIGTWNVRSMNQGKL